jgi:hypothetical protein
MAYSSLVRRRTKKIINNQAIAIAKVGDLSHVAEKPPNRAVRPTIPIAKRSVR